MALRKSKFHCVSEAQKAAIRRNYAIRNIEKDKDGRVETSYPHFRYYRKSRHPALIVGEMSSSKGNVTVEEYRYRKVMHAEKDGRHLNEKIEPNPDPSDPDPMYIAKRVRHDEKSNFAKKPLPWEYPGK